MTKVFVPQIGFRPAATRTLRESVEATQDSTRVVLHAVAAAPDRTDVVIEWHRAGDPATCPPDSRILVHSNRQPLDNGLAAEITTDATSAPAASMLRRSYQMSLASSGAIDALRFSALPADVDHAELRLREATTEWRVPFSLEIGGVDATAIDAHMTQDGVVIRAKAICRYQDELIVEVEIEAPVQIRQVAGPVPSPQRHLDTSAEDQAARRAEMQRVFGDRAQPITLEDDRGMPHAEARRLLPHELHQAAPAPFVTRFCVMFDALAADVRAAALVVPFVELNDLGPSATVDLRDLPRDVELSQYRFRVAAVEDRASDQTRIRLELAPSPAGPRFMQPARVRGADPEFGWQREAVGPSTDDREIWMTTKVGDPPIVTFTGVVLRVDGPLRVDLPL